MKRLTLLLSLLLCWYGSGVLLRAQERVVSGVVTDAADGSPLPQVNIQIKGTQSGTISDNEGRYQLRVPGPETVLFFFYTGYESKEVVVAERSVINVVLGESHEEIEQVVVTGYQKIEKERSTGSYAILNQKELDRVKVADLSDRLEEVAAGVAYNSATGKLQIRGVTSLNANAAPLVVLDGLPFDGGLEMLNPATVKSVTILRDAAAASIYGARAANGVIVVETIKGDGSFQVQYDGMVQVRPIAAVAGLHRMSSAEYVDFTDWLYRNYGKDQLSTSRLVYTDPIRRRFIAWSLGRISESAYQSTLDSLRVLDNRGQIRSLLERVGVYHSHSLTVSGGDKFRFLGTAHYEQNLPNDRRMQGQTASIHLRNLSEFNRYVSMDAGVQVQFSGAKSYTGTASAESFYRNEPSYRMLYGPDGEALQYYLDRSEYGIDSVQNQLGLLEERFFPAKELRKSYQENTGLWGRSHLALTFKPLGVLSVEASGALEFGSGRTKDTDLEESYRMAKLYNNGSVVTPEVKHYIPRGGRLMESLDKSRSYTLRLQANYDQTFGIHRITALLGSEIQEKLDKVSMNELLGYNPQSLAFAYVDEIALVNGVPNTAILNSNLFVYNFNKGEREALERFFSVYSTASYSLLQRYNITGSIRIDQSNLWGTAPGVQWKPLWSVGASWQIDNEAFMENAGRWLNMLVLRSSYGISGNVPRGAYPMIVVEPGINSNVSTLPSLQIENAPNPFLRWEKTATGNVGIDWAMFGHRFTGSAEWYYRLTTDLLGNRPADPTLGWSSVLVNYGRMVNTGVELSMYGQLLAVGDFSISANLLFSYNRSKLLDVRDGEKESTVSRVMTPVQVEGYPYASLFSYRFAGLSPTDGSPELLLQDGTRAPMAKQIEDLTFSGTVVPLFNSSLSLTFGWRGLTLSGTLLYRGGHVMRRPVASYGAWNALGYDRDYLNVWKQPGDEQFEETIPAPSTKNVGQEQQYAWSAADRHILRADYIKLNSLTLAYELPQRWLEPIRIAGFTVAFQVENIVNIPFNKARIDPETVGSTTAAGYWLRKMPPFYTASIKLNI